MTAKNQWQPIYGEDIEPTNWDRVRSGVVLCVVLIVLGITFAAGLVLSVVTFLGLVGAAAG